MMISSPTGLLLPPPFPSHHILLLSPPFWGYLTCCRFSSLFKSGFKPLNRLLSTVKLLFRDIFSSTGEPSFSFKYISECVRPLVGVGGEVAFNQATLSLHCHALVSFKNPFLCLYYGKAQREMSPGLLSFYACVFALRGGLMFSALNVCVLMSQLSTTYN